MVVKFEFSPKLTLVNKEQLKNAPGSMFVTLSGILILFNEERLKSKANLGISVTPSGIVTSSIFDDSFTSIKVTLFFVWTPLEEIDIVVPFLVVNCFKFVQFQKALGNIHKTSSPIVTFFNEKQSQKAICPILLTLSPIITFSNKAQLLKV